MKVLPFNQSMFVILQANQDVVKEKLLEVGKCGKYVCGILESFLLNAHYFAAIKGLRLLHAYRGKAEKDEKGFLTNQ